MTPERFRRIEELCHAALERDATLRAAFLQESCAGDSALRREVESLLAQEGQVGSSLEASPLQEIVAQGGREAIPFGEERSESQNAAEEASRAESLAGRQLGSYLVRSKIGEGGMGEVFRAFDIKLQRDVALKVLPKPFARDPERLARFRREAQMLASLKHKNVAAIYGFEELPEENFLILELVEGETFAERIKRQGGLPIKEALTLAGQVAEGLEAAHRKGITHRDIKPENIKVTPEGDVKVLDFGLAKAYAGDRANADLSELPKREPGPTKDGQILGTPAYMSPEQVRGQEVDKRTDIWAFGCVLYELLTGQCVFQSRARQQAAHPSRAREGAGKVIRPGSVADTISAILNEEPDWTALPASTPATIRSLLRRCLQKDANRRLHDIADARIEIEEALATPASVELAAVSSLPGRPVRNVWRWALAAGLTCAILAAVAVWYLKPSLPPAAPVTRFELTLPQNVTLARVESDASLALSPDGRLLAYVATSGGAPPQLFVRAMDGLETRALPGTEDAASPFFSPDGQWLGFFVAGKLKKVSSSGGAPVTLVDAPRPAGASWGTNGSIVFASSRGLLQVPAEGGTPKQLTTPDPKIGEVAHGWPQILPGNKAVLFSSGGNTVFSVQIVVQQLETGERRTLVPDATYDATYARYVPTGHLLYVQAGDLWAAPFDLERLELTGAAVRLVQGVRQSLSTGAALFSASDLGSLVYATGPGGSENTLVWVDRKGTAQPLGAPPRGYFHPQLSPDGRQLAVVVGGHIWLYDILRATLTRLTFEGLNVRPLWTPDGKRIAYRSSRAKPSLYWKLTDGTGEEEEITKPVTQPSSISPDGKLVFYNLGSANTGSDIWTVPLEGERKPSVFLQTPFDESTPKISPDGHWLAYVSNESGRSEIFVRAYPGPGGKWQISMEGGSEPLWARNGRELFYRIGDKVMAVDITTQPSFQAGTPRLLFEGNYERRVLQTNFDVSPDGQRFLMIKPGEQQTQAATEINVVLNWFTELQQRVPTK